MVGFFSIADFTETRQLNTDINQVKDLGNGKFWNAKIEVFFREALDFLERVSKGFEGASFLNPSLEGVNFFLNTFELLPAIITNQDTAQIACANLFQAFIKLGTYDGIIYACRAILGANTDVVITLLEHKKLRIDVSNYASPNRNDLVTETPDDIVTEPTDVGDPNSTLILKTEDDFIFEGNFELVKLLVNRFIATGVIYELKFLE